MQSKVSIAAIASMMAIAAPASADEPPAVENKPVEAAPAPVAQAAAGPRDVKPAETLGTQRVLGAAVGVIGFLTTMVGGFFTISALSLHDEAKSRCESRGCSTSDVDDSNKARSRANVGGFVFIGGLALVGGGVALWFTAPKPTSADKPDAKKTEGRLGIMPTLGGLSAVGTF